MSACGTLLACQSASQSHLCPTCGSRQEVNGNSSFISCSDRGPDDSPWEPGRHHMYPRSSGTHAVRRGSLYSGYRPAALLTQHAWKEYADFTTAGEIFMICRWPSCADEVPTDSWAWVEVATVDPWALEIRRCESYRGTSHHERFSREFASSLSAAYGRHQFAAPGASWTGFQSGLEALVTARGRDPITH